MNLMDFMKRFPDEQTCIDHFRKQKEKEVIQCSQCGGITHYWLRNKMMHECKGCKRRLSIRSGTSLTHTKLSFHYWFITLHLMTATKKGFSSLEIKRQLGHKRYEPIFRMMHKIRMAMGKRDDQYTLKDMVELDDAYIETCTDHREKEHLKRGKGSQRQTKVTVMAESVVLENLKKKTIERQCRYFKMKLNESEQAEAIKEIVEKHVSNKAIIFTDNSNAYTGLYKIVEDHKSENSKDTYLTRTLQWVHVATSNLKRNLLGIHHSINGLFLQNYLDEYCYKLNRRYFGEKLFERAFIAITNF